VLAKDHNSEMAASQTFSLSASCAVPSTFSGISFLSSHRGRCRLKPPLGWYFSRLIYLALVGAADPCHFPCLRVSNHRSVHLQDNLPVEVDNRNRRTFTAMA